MHPTWQTRAPSLDDAPAILALLNACDVAEYGTLDSTLEDLHEVWDGIDLSTDGWVVTTPQQQIIGYAVGSMDDPSQATAEVATHPDYCNQGIGTYLCQQTEAWAFQRSHMVDTRALTLTQTISGVNHAAQRLLTLASYSPTRHFYRMTIDLPTPPPQPSIPSDITLRQFVPEQDAYDVYTMMTDAFAESWRANPPTFETWSDFMIDRDDFEPSLWWLAHTGDSLVGAILSYPYLDMGWVRQVGVRPTWRKRGLGAALLYQAFGTLYERGIQRVSLGVNAQNNTGATKLYARVGMAIERQYDTYAKRIQVE